MSPPHPPGGHARPTAATMTRRSLLLGGGALVLLAACGSSDDQDASGAITLQSGGADQSLISLLNYFPNSAGYAYAGSPQRLNFGLAGAQGAPLDKGPATLTFTVTSDGEPVGAPIKVALHNHGIPRGYYPLMFTPPHPGNYTAHTEVQGQQLSGAFQVVDRADVPIVGPGQPVPAVTTPTTSDHRGVEPICTAEPPCPLHEVSLDAALGLAKAIAFLVATPKYCQTAICGPVLDLLVDAQPEYADRITMIHNEVYLSGAEAAKNLGAAKLTPAVEALHLTFEPSLVLVKPDGTVLRRLDTAYDADELRQNLDDLAAAR